MTIHPLVLTGLLLIALLIGYVLAVVVEAFRHHHQRELRAAAHRTVAAGNVARAYDLQMVDVYWYSDLMIDTDGTKVIRTKVHRRDNGQWLQTAYADTDGNPYTLINLRVES